MEQRSNEWYEARRGRFTASSVSKLMGKDLYTATAQSYIMEKVAEELGGRDEPVDSAAMRYGRDMEPNALNRLQEMTGLLFDAYGLIVPDWCPHFGVSPDGISSCGTTGCEIKCPYTIASHALHLMFDSVDALKKGRPDYYWQCIAALSVTDCERWIFFSYNPTFNPDFQTSTVVIARSVVQSDIQALKDRVLQAAKIKEEIVSRLIFG